MLALPTRSASREPGRPERIGRRVTVAHSVTLAVIALAAIVAYVSLERAIVVQRDLAVAAALTQKQALLSQRIAGLAAQYALGNAAVRNDLRETIGAFEATHWRLASGNSRIGLTSAASDRQLSALYFEGRSALDASASEFITRARRVAALTPQDPSLGSQLAPIFAAAHARLPDELEAALRVREQRAGAQLAWLRISGAASCLTILLALLAATLAVFRPMALQIIRLTGDADALAAHATIDPLTGMLNKRSFQARGAIEIQKARRYHRPLSLLRIDADQLSSIEATYGPGGGETLLRALTSSFFDGTRVSDLVARVDAEQFAILLPETDRDGAELLAERLRRKVNELSVPIDDAVVSCTISVGVAAAERDAAYLWPTFQRADEAVYEAKARGRNRVVVSTAA